MSEVLTHVSAGPAARLAAARLAGLGKSWRLDGLCALGRDSVRLSLVNGRHRLAFSARSSDRGLSVEAEGESIPAVDKLLEAVRARLSPGGLDGLLRIIDDDPDSFTELVTAGQDGDRIKVPCVGQSIGMLESGWRNFYCDQDFEVLLGVPGCRSNERTLNIEYADLECFYARPKLSFRKWSFLDYPEEEISGGQAPKTGDSIVTELDERDMILGTGEKADALLDTVRASAGERKHLVFTHLCTPIVMGEDLNGLARRCEKACGGKAVSWTQKDRDRRDNFGDYLRELLAKPGFFDAPGEPALVNLFHFPAGYRREELTPFLRELGLEVGVAQFPDVDFTTIEGLAKAHWQVFCERSSYPVKLKELLAGRPRAVVEVAAPYGVAATRDCLGTIAAAAGKSAEFEKWWTRKLGEAAPQWEALKKEAAQHSVAFVVNEATLPRLSQLRFGLGAPLLKVIQEMGFGVKLLYYDLHGRPPGAPAAVFRTPRELEAALREGEFQAVYSDMAFDWRITSAGKARFSSRDFEMGLAGAQRGLKRLLAACRLPFYRRYGGNLRRRPARRHAS